VLIPGFKGARNSALRLTPVSYLPKVCDVLLSVGFFFLAVNAGYVF
jgi:hypothetical protein